MAMIEGDVYEKRCAESKRILDKYPDRVPVIIRRNAQSNHVELEKKKFLVSHHMQWQDFGRMIGKHMKGNGSDHSYCAVPRRAVKLSVNGTHIKSSSFMLKVYNNHKSSDGFLYVTIDGFVSGSEGLSSNLTGQVAREHVAAAVKECIKGELNLVDQLATAVKDKMNVFQGDGDQDQEKMWIAIEDIENRVAFLETSEKNTVVETMDLGQRISAVENAVKEKSTATEASQLEQQVLVNAVTEATVEQPYVKLATETGHASQTNADMDAEWCDQTHVSNMDVEQSVQTHASIVDHSVQPDYCPMMQSVLAAGTFEEFERKSQTEVDLCTAGSSEDATQKPEAEMDLCNGSIENANENKSDHIQPDPLALCTTLPEETTENPQKLQAEMDLGMGLMENAEVSQPDFLCRKSEVGGKLGALCTSCTSLPEQIQQKPVAGTDLVNSVIDDGLERQQLATATQTYQSIPKSSFKQKLRSCFTGIIAAIMLLAFASFTHMDSMYCEHTGAQKSTTDAMGSMMYTMQTLESDLQEETWKSQNLSQVVKTQLMTIQQLKSSVEQMQLAQLEQQAQQARDEFSWLVSSEFMYVVIMACGGWLLQKLIRDRLPLFLMNVEGWMSTLKFTVTEKSSDQETVRFIDIRCPGVLHEHIQGDIFFNGITVHINKPADNKLPAFSWTRKFQFPCKEGLFDFKADEAKLENGILSLVLRAAVSVQTRVFKFPPHFNLATTDAGQDWDFEHSDAVVPLEQPVAFEVASEAKCAAPPSVACSGRSAPACLQPTRDVSEVPLEHLLDVEKAEAPAPQVLIDSVTEPHELSVNAAPTKEDEGSEVDSSGEASSWEKLDKIEPTHES